MATLNLGLDSYEAYGDYSPIPNGEYDVTICDSEIQSGYNGENRLSYSYRIEGGQYNGRIIFDTFNLWSQNATAREVSARRLKSLAVACGYPNPNFIGDSSDLHGFSCRVRTAQREYNDKVYVDVKAYSKSSNANAQAPKPNAMPSVPPSESKSAMPWG